MDRFDGPAGGTKSASIPRDELEQAAHEFEDESGSASESEPDHISPFPRNARGVDAKLVRFNHFTLYFKGARNILKICSDSNSELKS